MRAHMVPVGFGTLPFGQVRQNPQLRGIKQTPPGTCQAVIASNDFPKVVEPEGL
jgi:hypothetical protein